MLTLKKFYEKHHEFLNLYNVPVPVRHHSADYIFISFGIIGPLWFL